MARVARVRSNSVLAAPLPSQPHCPVPTVANRGLCRNGGGGWTRQLQASCECPAWCLAPHSKRRMPYKDSELSTET